MLLLYVTVSCVLLGSSAGIEHEKVCYGRQLKFPFRYTPPIYKGPLYFTPSNGGSRKLIMDNGEAEDPRIRSFFGSVRLTDLTERDEGTFSVSDGGSTYDIVTLKILDCPDLEITENYGAMYYFDVPSGTEFLEFTPLGSLEQPEVLWNRSNPQTSKGGRGQMKSYSWQVIRLTQADNGYYNFRGRDHTLLSRIRLTVEENNRHYDTKVNKQLLIRYPSVAASWTVTFTPEGEEERQTVMKAGKLITEDDGKVEASHHFTGRILATRDGIDIDPVEITDSGTFEFRDSQGYLAQTIQVEVNHESAPTFVYVAIIVGIIFAVIVCCCCVRKCCCKKSSSKRDQSAPQTAAAPAVYYHGENQPAGPSNSAASYSYQPMNSLVSREPATTSPGPSVYNPVNIHVTPPQPEVAPLGGQGAAPASVGSDCLSSDPDPKFELKGLTFASAPPLSSNSTLSDVYTSDKLNFL